MNLQTMKLDLARSTWRGLPNILAAVGLWSSFGALGIILPDMPQRALIYLFGAGLLVPLGLLAAALLRIDLFAKGNPLAVLGGYLGGLQILFIPLMVGAYLATPQFVPWYLGVLVGAHFLPFAWLYDSRAYLFGSIVTTLAAALTGWLLPALTYVATPFAVVAALLLTALLLWRERMVDTAHRVATGAATLDRVAH
jgi:hypothetical protein